MGGGGEWKGSSPTTLCNSMPRSFHIPEVDKENMDAVHYCWGLEGATKVQILVKKWQWIVETLATNQAYKIHGT